MCPCKFQACILTKLSKKMFLDTSCGVFLQDLTDMFTSARFPPSGWASQTLILLSSIISTTATEVAYTVAQD